MSERLHAQVLPRCGQARPVSCATCKTSTTARWCSRRRLSDFPRLGGTCERRVNALLAAGAALLALTAVTACGNDSAEGRVPASAQANAVSGAPSAPAVTKSVGALTVRTDPTLEEVVVDGKGMSVDVFAKDTKPGVSSCDGECATQWPPVPAADAEAAKGRASTRSCWAPSPEPTAPRSSRSRASRCTTSPRTPSPGTSRVRVSTTPGAPPRPTAGRPA